MLIPFRLLHITLQSYIIFIRHNPTYILKNVPLQRINELNYIDMNTIRTREARDSVCCFAFEDNWLYF